VILVYALTAAIALWGLFLMYCALHASMKSGKFYLTPSPVRACSYVLLGVMIVADIGFNFTIGSALFLELPDIRRPTFTQRCASHLDDDDWRGRIANYVCDGWLSPFESSHCR
jgi:hypothetical protein